MLKFHGTPIGGSKRDAVLFLSGRNALFSFHTKGHIPEVIECCDSFIVDNGAFSHWKTTGGTVDMQGYKKFHEEMSRYPNHYFSIIPDVIGGSEKENDDMLIKWESFNLKHCAPVFHLGESVERFKRLSENYEFVCLGSTDKWPRNGSNKWWEYMTDFLNSVTEDGFFKCKVHGLRMLDPRIFSKIPLHSADSTNAAVNGIYCQKEGIYRDLERWQGNVRVAQRVEHWQSARYWEESNLKKDMVSGLLESEGSEYDA